jgi:choline dehydrogenase-like flavoprotein
MTRPDPQADTPSHIDLAGLDDARLKVKLWAFDGQFSRFTFESCQDLVQHPRVTVITHATVTEIVTDAHARAVTSIIARSLTGRKLIVAARAFVLAAGGLENPRLLLASRSVIPVGLGNSHDLVGRYFMEHPHARGGRVIGGRPWALLKAFGRHRLADGKIVAALIAAGEAEQAKARILNSSLTVAARQPADAVQFWPMRAYNLVKHEMAPTRAGRALWMHVKRTATYLQRKSDPLRPWLLHRAGRLELALLIRAEQAPNPSSRVTIGAVKDAFGVPRIRLDWRLCDLDIHSVERLVDALALEFGKNGLGDVVKADWLSGAERQWRSDPLVSAHPIGGYHHMGTTRMAESAKQGVTDSYGRVHGMENLYLAGSSLFPTSGWANPTLTIVALALRSAEHIAAQNQTGVAAPAAAAAAAQ